MLREVWKKYNKSFLLILPLFWELTKGVRNLYSNAEYNVSQLLLEYGLINTYLYREKPVYDGKLHLVFDKKLFIKKFYEINTPYYSLCELILDFKYFDGFHMDTDYIVITLNLPAWANKDIEIIEKSKYSKVGEEYRNAVTTKQSTVPKSSTELIDFIARSNFASGIIERTKIMKERLEDVLDVTLSEDDEFLGEFNKEQECFNRHYVHKI